MRHRNRATLGNLFAEARQYRAIGTQHITKTSGHKFGLTFYPAILHRLTQTLHINFGHTLGSTHDIGRIHRLVGGNHNHLFHIVFQREIGQVFATAHIHTNSFARIFFHQRNMLISSGMENNLRTILFENCIQTIFVQHVTHDTIETLMRELVAEFQLQVVHGRFCLFVSHDSAGTHFHQLTTDFTTDRACRSGHHDGFVLQHSLDSFHVDIDFRTVQNIFHFHFANG